MNISLLTLSQTTNFRLIQTERVCRRESLIQWKGQRGLQKGRKHCGKRRNCSLRAISPFAIVISKDLYCRHVKTRACLGKPVNPFPNKPWFLRVCSTSFLKRLRLKEKLLIRSNFSFSHSVFYLFG